MGNMYHNADIHRMYLSISFLFTCLSSLIIDIHFYPKGNQSWIFIDKTDAEAEAPILWPPDVKSQLIRKDPDVRKDWRQEKGTTEDEMVGGITDSTDMSLSKLWELVKDRKAWHAAINGISQRVGP